MNVLAGSDGDAHLSGRVLNVTYDVMLVVAVDVRGEVIRLHGVDIPETDDDTWRSARNFCRKMVLGKNVSIKPMGRDRWGRKLGRVYVDGRCLNDALIEAGWVRPRLSKAPMPHLSGARDIHT